MPNSCRSILNKLLRDKRITQFEYDKLMRNLCSPKPVVCVGGNKPIYGYLDKSRQVIYLSYIDVASLCEAGYQITGDKEADE